MTFCLLHPIRYDSTITFSFFSICSQFHIGYLHVHFVTLNSIRERVTYLCLCIFSQFTYRSVTAAGALVGSQCEVARARAATQARYGGSRGARGRCAHRLKERGRLGRLLRARRLRVRLGRLLRRRGGRPHVVETWPRRVARRQRNADDWVRFKTPAWRTSCIMRSFSWRTADKHKHGLIIVITQVNLGRKLQGSHPTSGYQLSWKVHTYSGNW